MSTLARTVTVHPAYDCIGVQPCALGSKDCIPGTGGSHGRKSAEMHFVVSGEEAEVALVISTGWDLPTVPQRHRETWNPRGSFVELHTARARYEGQEGNEPRSDGTCKDWAGCYVDQGYLMSDAPTALLVEKGSDALWEWLENLYKDTISEMNKLTYTPRNEISDRFEPR